MIVYPYSIPLAGQERAIILGSWTQHNACSIANMKM